jgi:hypothetical protein
MKKVLSHQLVRASVAVGGLVSLAAVVGAGWKWM